MARSFPLGLSSPEVFTGDPEKQKHGFPLKACGNDRKDKTRKSSEEKYDSIDFSELFGNTNPVEIEIGCGKGKFLAGQAAEHPEINFLGIDRIGKWMKRVKIRTEREKVANLRFIKAEARTFLQQAVAFESVSVFHVYFPDPWPKRRHQKRRVVGPDFLRLLHSRLVKGGLLEIATDDPDYYEQIKKSIAATGGLWDNIHETQNQRIMGGMRKTSYELKFESQGKTLFYVELKKQ